MRWSIEHTVAGWVVAGLTVLAVAPGAAAQTEAGGAVLTTQVTNSSGEPISNAEAFLIENVHGMPMSHTWMAADAMGRVTFHAASLDAEDLDADQPQWATLVVRAADYAWTMQKVQVPSAEVVEVSLDAGRVVEIALRAPEGSTLPADLVPHVFTEGQSVSTWLTVVQRYKKERGAGAMFSAAVPERVAGGRHRVRVPEECAAIWVLVNHEGYLRAFQAGPFDADAMEEGPIEIDLPRAATLAIQLGPDETTAHAYEKCGTMVYTSPEIPDGGWSFSVHTGYSDEPTMEVELTDLAPRYYSVNAMTGDKSNRSDRDRADYFQTQQGVTLAAGERGEATFALQTYDEEALRAKLKGEHALTVKVTLADGSPATGRPYALSFALQRFGRNLEIASGTLADTGAFTVEGLPPGSAAFLEVTIDGEDAGYVFIDENEAETVYEVSVAPKAGDLAPDMELTRLADGSTFRLSELRGQVVYVDFWASWCGPCQEPMAHSDSVMARREDWKGRAVIIGASIDNGIEIIREHVNKRGWTNVVQTFCSEGEAGWQCEAAKRYAVRGVPTCFLIDQEGRIKWTGHPSEIDAEKEIDALLGSRR